MEFRDWITQKYLDWRGDAVGREKTISEFAELIGVSQPLMSGWLSGNFKPSLKYIDKLAAYFGTEAYDVLNIPDADRAIRPDIREAIRKVPPENTDELLQLIDKFLRDHGWKRS